MRGRSNLSILPMLPGKDRDSPVWRVSSYFTGMGHRSCTQTVCFDHYTPLASFEETSLLARFAKKSVSIKRYAIMESYGSCKYWYI